MKTYVIDPSVVAGQYHATPTQEGVPVELVLGPTVSMTQSPASADLTFPSGLGEAPKAGSTAMSSEVK
jgi:hypothetical protein